MDYSFNKDIACFLNSADKAVIIQNIAFWIKKNIANKKHFYSGYFWTYNSLDAFVDLFPWLNRDKIYRLLDSMDKAGIIIKSEFNKKGYDRTKWYTIKNEKILKIYGIDHSVGSKDSEKDESGEFVIDAKGTKIKTKHQLKGLIYDTIVAAGKEPDEIEKTKWFIMISKIINRAVALKGNSIIDLYYFFKSLFSSFFRLRAKSGFWKDQPVTPNTLYSKRIWELLMVEIQKKKMLSLAIKTWQIK